MVEFFQRFFASETIQVIGASFLVAATATWAMRMLAPVFGFLDLPGKQRFHEHVTPLLGGAAIFTTLLVVGGGLSLGYGKNLLFGPDHILFYIGLSSLFIMGLIDDRRPLNPVTKLLVQFFAALAFTSAGFRMNLMESEFLNLVLSVIWIVGLVNAMNLLDNIDGLCGTITLVGSAGLMFFLASSGDARMALLAAITIGASAGFLTQNLYKAKIFLGDAGSMLLGGILAGLSLRSTEGGNLNSHLAVAILLSLPLLDTMLVSIHRTLNGRGIMVGGKDHLSHRLSNHFKLGPTKAVMVMASYAVAITFLAIWVREEATIPMGVVVFALGLLGILGFILSLKNTYDYKADQVSKEQQSEGKVNNVVSLESQRREPGRKRKSQKN